MDCGIAAATDKARSLPRTNRYEFLNNNNNKDDGIGDNQKRTTNRQISAAGPERKMMDDDALSAKNRSERSISSASSDEDDKDDDGRTETRNGCILRNGNTTRRDEISMIRRNGSVDNPEFCRPWPDRGRTFYGGSRFSQLGSLLENADAAVEPSSAAAPTYDGRRSSVSSEAGLDDGFGLTNLSKASFRGSTPALFAGGGSSSVGKPRGESLLEALEKKRREGVSSRLKSLQRQYGPPSTAAQSGVDGMPIIAAAKPLSSAAILPKLSARRSSYQPVIGSKLSLLGSSATPKAPTSGRLSAGFPIRSSLSLMEIGCGEGGTAAGDGRATSEDGENGSGLSSRLRELLARKRTSLDESDSSSVGEWNTTSGDVNALEPSFAEIGKKSTTLPARTVPPKWNFDDIRRRGPTKAVDDITEPSDSESSEDFEAQSTTAPSADVVLKKQVQSFAENEVEYQTNGVTNRNSLQDDDRDYLRNFFKNEVISSTGDESFRNDSSSADVSLPLSDTEPHLDRSASIEGAKIAALQDRQSVFRERQDEAPRFRQNYRSDDAAPETLSDSPRNLSDGAFGETDECARHGGLGRSDDASRSSAPKSFHNTEPTMERNQTGLFERNFDRNDLHRRVASDDVFRVASDVRVASDNVFRVASCVARVASSDARVAASDAKVASAFDDVATSDQSAANRPHEDAARRFANSRSFFETTSAKDSRSLATTASRRLTKPTAIRDAVAKPTWATRATLNPPTAAESEDAGCSKTRNDWKRSTASSETTAPGAFQLRRSIAVTSPPPAVVEIVRPYSSAGVASSEDRALAATERSESVIVSAGGSGDRPAIRNPTATKKHLFRTTAVLSMSAAAPSKSPCSGGGDSSGGTSAVASDDERPPRPPISFPTRRPQDGSDGGGVFEPDEDIDSGLEDVGRVNVSGNSDFLPTPSAAEPLKEIWTKRGQKVVRADI